jgi:hypothetical protein
MQKLFRPFAKKFSASDVGNGVLSCKDLQFNKTLVQVMILIKVSFVKFG